MLMHIHMCTCALYICASIFFIVLCCYSTPREYERVAELEDVDRNDFVAYTKSKHQRVRDMFDVLLDLSMCRYGMKKLVLIFYFLQVSSQITDTAD